MAINSVSTATSGIMQQQIAARPSRDSQEPRPAQAAKRSPAQRPENTMRRDQAARPAEAPKPVINAQGQKTGSIINTTA